MKSVALNIAKFDNCLFKLAVATSHSAVLLADYGPHVDSPIFEFKDYNSLPLVLINKVWTQMTVLYRKIRRTRFSLYTYRLINNDLAWCRAGLPGGRIARKVKSAQNALRKLSDDMEDVFDGIVKDLDAILSWVASVQANEAVQKTIRVDLWKKALNYLNEVVNQLSALTEISSMADRIGKEAIKEFKPQEKNCSTKAAVKLNTVHRVASLSLNILSSFLWPELSNLIQAGNFMLDDVVSEKKHLQKIEQHLQSAQLDISAAAQVFDEYVAENWKYVE